MTTQNPTPAPTEVARPSPASGGDDLAALLQTWAPALALFNPSAPVVATGEEVIAQLESSLADMSAMFPDHPTLQLMQEEIDRYIENGLVERASMSVGTTPQAGIIVYRFESETGAAADFQLREASCDDVTMPGAEIADVVAKSCNVPDSHNDVYLIAHRGDLVANLQVRDLPENQPLEPAVATLAQIFLALDPLLTP